MPAKQEALRSVIEVKESTIYLSRRRIVNRTPDELGNMVYQGPKVGAIVNSRRGLVIITSEAKVYKDGDKYFYDAEARYVKSNK